MNLLIIAILANLERIAAGYLIFYFFFFIYIFFIIYLFIYFIIILFIFFFFFKLETQQDGQMSILIYNIIVEHIIHK